MPCFAKRTVASLVALMLAMPTPVLSAAESTPAAKAAPIVCQDLALSKAGLLQGQVLNPQGQPIADAKVWLGGSKGEPVAAGTDAQGRFAYKGLTRGVYYLQAGDALRVCRVWRHDAAPPKSIGGLLIVADEQAVRGQMGPPPLLNSFVSKSKKFFSHPVGMLTLGAAIATPIVLAATDDDDPPASP